MHPSDDKINQLYKDSVYSSISSQSTIGMSPVHGSLPLQGLPGTFTQSKSPAISVFRLNSKALFVTVSVLSFIALVGVGIATLKAPKAPSTPNSQYAVGTLPLNGVLGDAELSVGKLDQLTINGLLQANNTLILNPTLTPSTPVTGQIYYDSVTNQPYFYNGTKFVSLNPTTPVAGTSLGGLTGAIGLGQGLTVAGNQLGLANSFTSSLVTSLTGTANQINLSGTTGNIKLSLPQDIAVTSAPTFGGLTVNGSSTTTGNHTVQGQLIVNSTSTFNGTSTFDATAQPIGPELVTNGTFTGSTTAWTLGSNVTYNSGTNDVTSTYAGGDPSLSIIFNTVAGNTYQIKFDVSSANARMQVYTQNNFGPRNGGPFSNGSTIVEFVADYTGADKLYLDDYNYNTGDTWTLDNVSVKQVNSLKPALKVIGSDGNSWLTLGNDLNGNTALGDSSLHSNTTGYYNTSIGYSALEVNTTGVENTANGYLALSSNTFGSFNTAIGDYALSVNNIGDHNTAVGDRSLISNTMGFGNTAIGSNSLQNNTSSFYNTAIGMSALSSNTTGGNNTAIGFQSLLNNTTGNGNVALGTVLASNTTGSNNIALGYASANSVSSGSNNIVLGTFSGTSLTTGSNNISLGANTNFASATADNQLQIGSGISGDLAIGTLAVKTTGSDSATAFSVQDHNNTPVLTVDTANSQTILQSPETKATLDSAVVDTANSVEDFTTDWTGSNWTIGANNATYNGGSTDKLINTGFTPTIGATYQVRFFDTGCTNYSNTVTITFAGTTLQYPFNCIGSNVAVVTATTTDNFTFTPNSTYNGTVSDVVIQLISNQLKPVLTIKDNSGTPTLEIRSTLYNTYVGLNSGRYTTSFGANTGLGANSLQANTTGYYNTATGSLTLYYNTTGSQNTAIGNFALLNNSTGSNNTATGLSALGSITNGSMNTATGLYALGINFTSGSNNSALGSLAGYNLISGSNNLALGALTNFASATADNQLQIGAGISGDLALGTLAVKTVGGDSGSAFSVQNSTGTALLTADTSNVRVKIGSIGTPTAQLYVAGQIPTAQTGSVATDGSSNYATTSSGHYIYVTGSSSFQIFDVSNPSMPTLVGSVALSYSDRKSISVSGHYAYITNYNGNLLQIFDVSNPSTPTLVGSVATAGISPLSITVNGRYAYVTGGYVTSYLQIFDVSNPSTTTLISSLALNGSTPVSIVVSGRYAYIAYLNIQQFRVYDVSNPTTPVLVATKSTLAFSGAAEIAVSGHYAYVVGKFDNILQIFDVTNPASPVSVGSVATSSNAYSVAISGRYAYVSGAGVLQAFDIGGTYTQALEAGSAALGNLSIANDANISGSLSLGTGLTVEGSTLLAGDVGINGTTTLKNNSNSTASFQIQDASSNNLFTADTSGLIIIVSGTPANFATLTLTDSHFKSTQATAPTIGTPINCGVTSSAVVTAGSTDTAGSFVITAGTGVPATCDTVFSFNKAYGAAPKSVVISSTKAVGSATAERAATVSAASANNFTLKVNIGLGSNTPAASEVISYYYFVIE